MSILSALQDRLVSDWRQSYKWWSIRLLGGHAILQAVFIGLVKGITISIGTLGFVPLVWVPIIGVVASLLAIGARMLSQKKPESNDPLDYGC